MASSHKHGHVSPFFCIFMIVLGAFGTFVHVAIIGFAAVEYRQIFKVDNLIPKCGTRWFAQTSVGVKRRAAKRKKRRESGKKLSAKKKSFSVLLLFMEFSMWTSNLCACVAWFLLRTDLLFWGSRNKQFDRHFCHRIYMANFLLFFYGKMQLHLLLVYRLHIAFQNTIVEVSKVVMCSLDALIVASSITQMTIFVMQVLNQVEVDYSHKIHLRVCIVYGAGRSHQHERYHSRREFPIVCGVSETFIKALTFALFVKQLFAVASKTKDAITYVVVIRKLTVLGIVDVLFSMVFYAFAMPFYPQLVMLMPLDAVIDSLCVFLASDYAQYFYNLLCFPCDKVTEAAMRFVKTETTTSSGCIPPKDSKTLIVAKTEGSSAPQYGCSGALSALPSANSPPLSSALKPLSLCSVLEQTSSASMLMKTHTEDCESDCEAKTGDTLQLICTDSSKEDKGPQKL